METSRTSGRTIWSDGVATSAPRVLAEETAVAISYNGSTHAVLMATPADLTDLAVGFSFTEGIIDHLSAVESVAIESYDLGLDVQIRVREDVAARLASRRRSMAGPVGCGMCGLESLEAATRGLAPVASSTRFAGSEIVEAARSIEAHQELNRATGAAHAAGFFAAGKALSFVREDVGRHNALDKLIGALLRSGQDPASGGFLVTSRVSVELIQKVAVAGSGLLAAISAPTALAVRTAENADVTLIALVRGKSFEIFTRPDRISSEVMAHVA